MINVIAISSLSECRFEISVRTIIPSGIFRTAHMRHIQRINKYKFYLYLITIGRHSTDSLRHRQACQRININLRPQNCYEICYITRKHHRHHLQTLSSYRHFGSQFYGKFVKRFSMQENCVYVNCVMCMS